MATALTLQPSFALPAVLERVYRFKRTIMKQELNNSKVYLDQDELNMLVKEVKETVAANINLEKENENKNIFSAADLWKIQRMKTKIQIRSTLWN